jgi:hypothetical protein
LLILYYIRWTGTLEELKEYVGRWKSMCDGIEGINLKGVFSPSSEWNAVLLFEAVRQWKAVEAYRKLYQKYGPNPKRPVGKAEFLFRFEEKIGQPIL